jgi:hypothetical protein
MCVRERKNKERKTDKRSEGCIERSTLRTGLRSRKRER